MLKGGGGILRFLLQSFLIFLKNHTLNKGGLAVHVESSFHCGLDDHVWRYVSQKNDGRCGVVDNVAPSNSSIEASRFH